jgi:transcriptional regulator with XRE-family HTH domain
MTVGEKLRRARRKLKKLQRDIADAVGVTQPTVHAWENDKWSPSIEQVRDVAQAYGLQPADLLPPRKARTKGN